MRLVNELDAIKNKTHKTGGKKMKKKKVFALMMAATLALSLAGCGGSSSGDSKSSGSSDSSSVANKDKPLCWFNRQPSNSSTGELDKEALNFNKDTYYVGFDANQGAELQGEMVVDYIKANATLIENMDQSTDTLGEMSFEDFHKYIKDYLKNNNMQYVRVVDAETGEDVDYVEINTGICNDKLILNMNSLRGDKKVKIIADNQTITSSYDLRSGDNFGEVIELTKYEPVMLEINVSNQFIDTYNHWAENNISNLTSKGIIKGISNSRFVPDKQISIAEILALLARSYGLDCSSNEDDLKWYDGTIRALNNAGMDISEIRDFDKKATREDAAEWAVKFYEKFMAAINSGMANQYTDYSQINNKEAVDKATVAGIMSGYPDGSFGGNKGITRAEFATVLVNLLKK